MEIERRIPQQGQVQVQSLSSPVCLLHSHTTKKATVSTEGVLIHGRLLRSDRISIFFLNQGTGRSLVAYRISIKLNGFYLKIILLLLFEE